MKRDNNLNSFKLILFALDYAALLGIFWAVLRFIVPLYPAYAPETYAHYDNYASTAILLLLSYSVATRVWKYRISEIGVGYSSVLSRAVVQSLTSVLVFFFLCALIYKIAHRHLLIWQLIISCLALGLLHMMMLAFIRKYRKKDSNQRKVVFVGGDRNNQDLCSDMVKGFGVSGYKILGFFTSDDSYRNELGQPVLGKMNEMMSWLETNPDVDEIYSALNPSSPEQKTLTDELIQFCESHFITFYYVPNMDGYLKRRMEYTQRGGVTVINLYNEPLADPLNKIVKRMADVVISGLFLLFVFWWVYLIVGIGVKLSSPGPVFFKQKRTGYNGNSFNCLKFRSMRVSSDANSKQATADDPRKTKFGDFIRRTSIDELPQFINVFKGDMSIVGPRPHMEHHTEQYSELISEYMVRHMVKPGITGWAQVSGCRGETKTVAEMKDRVEHDIWYIENWSLGLDAQIFIKTILQILGGDKQAY